MASRTRLATGEADSLLLVLAEGEERCVLGGGWTVVEQWLGPRIGSGAVHCCVHPHQ